MTVLIYPLADTLLEIGLMDKLPRIEFSILVSKILEKDYSIPSQIFECIPYEPPAPLFVGFGWGALLEHSLARSGISIRRWLRWNIWVLDHNSIGVIVINDTLLIGEIDGIRSATEDMDINGCDNGHRARNFDYPRLKCG